MTYVKKKQSLYFNKLFHKQQEAKTKVNKVYLDKKSFALHFDTKDIDSELKNAETIVYI